MKIKCTGWTVIEVFGEWVGISLALCRVDGWVIIWSFLMMFLVTFWCFIYFVITSFIFMHEELCSHFTMLGVIVETFVVEKGIVAAIVLRGWLSWNWSFRIFTQPMLAWMIGDSQTHFSSLRKPLLSKEANQQPGGVLVTCHSQFSVPVHLGSWKCGWRHKPRSWNCRQDKKMHHDNAFNHINVFFPLHNPSIDLLYIH